MSTDMKKVDELYRKHYNDVLNFIKFKVNGNHELAEDIASTTFEKVIEYLPTFDEKKSNVLTWIKTIATSCVNDNFRGRSGNYMEKVSMVSDYVDENGKETFQTIADESANTLAERNDFSEKLANVLRSMKPKYRKVAILYFLRDKEYAEIAEICDTSIGNVCSMISRCKDIMRKQLQHERSEYLMA